MNAHNDIALISKDIERHWKLYNAGSPEISDHEFDALVRRLAELDPTNPLLEKISSPKPEGEDVVHAVPMLSLDKAYSLEEVLKWARKVARTPGEEFVVMPKYDGVSANFDGSVLSTRGDGMVGTNITSKFPVISVECDKVPGTPFRGEVLVRSDLFESRFKNVVRKDGGHYNDPRGAAVGILGLKDVSGVLAQGAILSLVDYELYVWVVNIEELEIGWEQVSKHMQELPYPMDGLVIALWDKAYAASLGNTAHHPRGSIAFKFPNKRVKTILRAIEPACCKEGISFTAIFDEVLLGASKTTRATLFNAKTIIDRDIRIGDIVNLEKAGDVIPYVESTEPGPDRAGSVQLPTHCPSCGTELVWESVDLVCKNAECKGTRMALLVSAVRNIGIERVGESTLEKMWEHMAVRNLADVYDLKKEHVMALPGFGEKSAEVVMREIDKRRVVPARMMLDALNIRHVGTTTSRDIMLGRSMEWFVDTPSKELKEELLAIKGVGPETVDSILRWLSDSLNVGYVSVLMGYVKTTNEAAEEKVSGPTVCFTGKMPEKRSFYEEEARKRGMSPVDSVSKGTSLLVMADPGSGSSKAKAAEKLGVPVKSVEDFMALPEVP
jgi:DNA ligase (NAD+)